MIRHFNLTVKGRVQGVWYRASTIQIAWELGLTGFVKNLSDGTVYIEAEGTPKALDQLVNWCWKGPRLAHVENVTVEVGEVEGFVDFNQQR